MYADYEYYSSVYHGSTVSENDYTPYAEKAGAYINNRTDFIFEESGMPTEGSSLERRLMTCSCALADEFFRTDTGAAYVKTSEKVGEHSVSYASGNVRTADERLFDIIELYLPDVIKAVRWI